MEKVDVALGRTAAVSGDVHRYGFPRTDLQVTLDGVTIKPSLALGGWVAFKPTHGLIPRTGVLQLSRALDHIGLFARSLDDLALLAAELPGYDEGDPDTRPRARVPFSAVLNEEPPIPPMFAFIKTPHWERVDADAREAYAELIETLGDRVEEVELFP